MHSVPCQSFFPPNESAPRQNNYEGSRGITCLQRALVRASLERIEAQAKQFGAIFQDWLFTRAPDLLPFFRGGTQARLPKSGEAAGDIVMLHMRVIASLPVLNGASGESVLPGAYWSGKLHAAYGVRKQDFDQMREGLIWSLEQALGAEMTPEIRDAWALAYDIAVHAMKAGMESPEYAEKDSETHVILG
jgi:hemoglobin-like flavoprotein